MGGLGFGCMERLHDSGIERRGGGLSLLASRAGFLQAERILSLKRTRHSLIGSFSEAPCQPESKPTSIQPVLALANGANKRQAASAKATPIFSFSFDWRGCQAPNRKNAASEAEA